MTVYFIRDSERNCIKIGYTASAPERRMAQLQTGHASKLTLLGSIPGDKSAEKGMHVEFKDFHKHGEWFIADAGLIGTIEYLIAGQLPWYHCRVNKFRWPKMAAEWKETFPASADDLIIEGANEYDLVKSIKDIRAFRRSEAKFVRHAKTWRPSKQERAAFFTRKMELFRNPAWIAASYIMA